MKLELLRLLNATQSQDFRLNVLEILGNMILMLHWQRGIIDMLIQQRTVKLNKVQKSNWDRIIKNLETYESFCWEIAPPRAILLILREYRLTNKLPDNFQYLNSSDSHGRVPYRTTNLDDIDDIIRKLKDCRIYDDNSEVQAGAVEVEK